MSYEIKIDNDNLKDYTPTTPVLSNVTQTGTNVIFNEVFPLISQDFVDKILVPYLKAVSGT